MTDQLDQVLQTRNLYDKIERLNAEAHDNGHQIMSIQIDGGEAMAICGPRCDDGRVWPLIA